MNRYFGNILGYCTGFISTIFNFTKRFSIDLESLADGENGLPSGLSPNDVRLRVPVGVAGDLYRIDVCLELVLVGARAWLALF